MTKRDGFDKHAMRVADNLRRMADEIEQGVTRGNDVADSTQEVVQIVTWGVANLQLGLLVRWMAQAMKE